MMDALFAHGQLGQCRRPRSKLPAGSTPVWMHFAGGRPPKWVQTSNLSLGFVHLHNLLYTIAAPGCGLTFIGDSISHDTYVSLEGRIKTAASRSLRAHAPHIPRSLC